MTRAQLARSFTTSRPVAVLMVFVAAVVFGWFSYGQLAVTLMPELSYPTLTVRTEYPGAAPEEVEKDINEPVEDALGVISGLRRISSVGRAGVSDVVLEFSWDTTMADALQDTLEKLDLVLLPEDAGRSLILRYDPSLDPVLELSLSSDRGSGSTDAELRRLRRVAELQVKRALEPIKGVAAVRIRGGLEEEVHVDLDRDRLTAAGLSIRDVIRRLEQENINIAGGTVKQGRTDFMVRTLNEFADLDQIRTTVIARTEGRDIRLSHLAEVTRSHADPEMATRTNGSESVQIDVFKEADANIVALAKRVRKALGELPEAASEGTAPGVESNLRDGNRGIAETLRDDEQVILAVVADRSLFIESAIDEVRNTAILGGLLAVVVLFLFLRNVRSTLVIAVSIPVSLLVTFAPLNLLGISLNIMSLGGLALGIGMLVDSSIVVLESIHRYREQGADIVTATVRGTRDVRGAVTASILTTIGVFLPMVFVEGVAGQAFGDLGSAVVVSLTASLLVALFLIPMLASRRFSDGGTAAPPIFRFSFQAWAAFRGDLTACHGAKRLLLPYLALRFVLAATLELLGRVTLAMVFAVLWLVTNALRRVLGPVARVIAWVPITATQWSLTFASRIYPGVLRWCLGNTAVVVAVLAASMVALVATARTLDSELLPEVHQGEFTMELSLPVGTPLEETQHILGSLEAEILTERDQIESVLVTYGYDPTNSQRSDEGEHTARFKFLLSPSSDNAATERQVAGRLRDKIETIPDLESRLIRPVLFSFRTPIEVEVYGDDLTELRTVTSQVEAALAALPELADVESTLRRGAPEVQIVYERDRLRQFGLNLSEVAEAVRDEVKGREATRLNLGDRRVPIVVRLSEDGRSSVAALRERVIDPSGSRTIRLSSVAEVGLGEGPSEVRRIDGHRVAVVRANLAPGAALDSAVASIEQRLAARTDWPAGFSFEVSGQSEEWDRSRASLWLALALSIFLVYVIMAAQFESLVYPLVIMFTIPLAFFGSFVALWALEIHLSIVVFLGMIMLAGIVVNNAIVLVDCINQIKARGRALDDAVIEAGSIRLRPILLTTATTALGLIPMAVGMGDGAEIRAPLAITVIAGLIASTALTLIVIPTIYTIADRLLSAIRPGRVEAES